jgi:hypothetical protein
MLAAVLVPQWMTNTPGIIQERTRNELAAAAAMFSGSRVSWRWARGRTSSRHWPGG